jgi:hypothetical protein
MTRRWRSFRCGRTTSKNRASASGPTSTSSGYYARSNVRWTLSVGCGRVDGLDEGVAASRSASVA